MADDDVHPLEAGDSPAKSVPEPVTASPLDMLAEHVYGCRNDVSGIAAKKQLVESYVQNNKDTDYLEVLCYLHKKRCITIDPAKLLQVVSWKKGSATTADSDQVRESANVGFFLANALSPSNPENMLELVKSFITSNPKVDQVELLRYVNAKGFVEYQVANLTSPVSWVPPADTEDGPARWRVLWGRLPRSATRTHGHASITTLCLGVRARPRMA